MDECIICEEGIDDGISFGGETICFRCALSTATAPQCGPPQHHGPDVDRGGPPTSGQHETPTQGE